MIRKLIAYIVSPPLFAIGHVASRCGLDWYVLAWLYQKVMAASYDVEEWAGVEIMWKEPD